MELGARYYQVFGLASYGLRKRHQFISLTFNFNTSYLTDSYIGFTLKMESVTKNTIFCLKMIMKSSLEKFILKSLHAFYY